MAETMYQLWKCHNRESLECWIIKLRLKFGDFGLGTNFEDKIVTDSHYETINYKGTEVL